MQVKSFYFCSVKVDVSHETSKQGERTRRMFHVKQILAKMRRIMQENRIHSSFHQKFVI